MRDAPTDIDASAIALFLDVDGTLLDILEHPDDVRSDLRLIELLQAAEVAVGGALSLISGRSISALDRIFDPVRFPASGAHGVEFRLPGSGETRVSAEPMPASALRRLREFAARNGLLLEEKRGGIALHYRRAPELEAACREIAFDVLATHADGYRLIDGKKVLEIVPADRGKGTAIREFLEHAPFRGRVPVFVGDDVTDEDGFCAVNELQGISIRVGADATSAAGFRLADVAGVIRWLGTVISKPAA